MKKLNNKGFSLVEILVAIALLAILMTIASQAYNSYKKQARQQAYDTMAKSATVAATNYLMENNKAKYISFETLKEICNTVKIPVVAIGGITESNMTQLANSQICGIATVSAIFAAGSLDEIKIASCNLRKKSEDLFAN